MAAVAHLTSVHAATDVRILHKECRTLSAAGHDVLIVGQHPRDETVDGVYIRGVPRPDGRLDRLRRIVPAVRRIALTESMDLFHVHDPELIPLAWELRGRGGTIVYDAHEDLSSQVYAKEWLPESARFLIAQATRPLASVVGRTFHGVVAATPAIAATFGSNRSVVVRNYPLEEEFTEWGKPPYEQRSEILAYVGGISRARGIIQLVKALELLPEASPARLELAGRFESSELENMIRSLPGWNRARFRGWLSREGIKNLLGKARMGLVTLLPTPNHVESLPVKLFEYMAAGIPMIASDFPLWREIIAGTRCGLLVDPTSPRDIADSIRSILESPEMAQEWGRNGRVAFEEEFNWAREGRRLVDYYARILSR